MATKKEAEVKDIKVSLELKTMRIPIEGIAPLIVSRFDEKSKRQIEESAPGKLKQGKKKVDEPEEQYLRSLYVLSDGKRTGFPARAFKAAMVRAGKEIYNMPMVSCRSYFRVIADDAATDLVEIHGEHKMREDMVRVGGVQKTASPRYRACYPEWSACLTIQYVAGTINEEQIVGLVNTAGFCCGVGEWRPEKSNSGSFGLFRVVNTAG